jgi:hypothetical protein
MTKDLGALFDGVEGLTPLLWVRVLRRRAIVVEMQEDDRNIGGQSDRNFFGVTCTYRQFRIQKITQTVFFNESTLFDDWYNIEKNLIIDYTRAEMITCYSLMINLRP